MMHINRKGSCPMKAIAYRQPGTIDRPDALLDVDLPTPVAEGRDLLVEIAAVAVNPVDTKVRKSAAPAPGTLKVLGWDAVGRVVAVGDEATAFQPGDEVWYAGSIARPGANSQFHLVDERLVGQKPKSLTNAEAAALPLTAITAWEMLFDRLDVRRGVPGAANAILIVGGAGRRRVDRHPACPRAHRPHRHRHGVARRNGSLGARTRRPACRRSLAPARR